jgi:hypothetical protein
MITKKFEKPVAINQLLRSKTMRENLVSLLLIVLIVSTSGCQLLGKSGGGFKDQVQHGLMNYAV